jgi:hypothetical protein
MSLTRLFRTTVPNAVARPNRIVVRPGFKRKRTRVLYSALQGCKVTWHLSVSATSRSGDEKFVRGVAYSRPSPNSCMGPVTPNETRSSAHPGLSLYSMHVQRGARLSQSTPTDRTRLGFRFNCPRTAPLTARHPPWLWHHRSSSCSARP